MRKRRHRSRTPMGHRNWLLREHGGMPGWAIVAALVVGAAMFGYAVTHAA